MKTSIIQVYTDDWMELASVVLPNIEGYCRRWGYRFLPIRIPTAANIGFSKMAVTLDHMLAPDPLDVPDVVMCLDLDLIITNYNIPVTSFIDDNHSMFVARDLNGINAGSVIYKNSHTTRMLHHDIIRAGEKTDYPHEQAVMQEMWWDISSYCKVLPHPSINSYDYAQYAPDYGVIGSVGLSQPTHEEGNWEVGDYIIHYPGMPLERRVRLIKEKLQQVVS